MRGNATCRTWRSAGRTRSLRTMSHVVIVSRGAAIIRRERLGVTGDACQSSDGGLPGITAGQSGKHRSFNGFLVAEEGLEPPTRGL